MTDHAAAPAEHTSPYVFICYAHDDREAVVEQVAWLRDGGIRVWYDEAIEAGSRWSDDLARAVDGCSAFLYFLSPRSVSSRYCLDEVHYALECGRPVIPVEIAPVTLTPGLKLSLGGQHRLFMHRMEPAEFRRKLERGLREAMARGAIEHPIESRPAGARRLPLEPLFAVQWRPYVFGIVAALAAFVAMMLATR